MAGNKEDAKDASTFYTRYKALFECKEPCGVEGRQEQQQQQPSRRGEDRMEGLYQKPSGWKDVSLANQSPTKVLPSYATSASSFENQFKNLFCANTSTQPKFRVQELAQQAAILPQIHHRNNNTSELDELQRMIQSMNEPQVEKESDMRLRFPHAPASYSKEIKSPPRYSGRQFTETHHNNSLEEIHSQKMSTPRALDPQENNKHDVQADHSHSRQYLTQDSLSNQLPVQGHLLRSRKINIMHKVEALVGPSWGRVANNSSYLPISVQNRLKAFDRLSERKEKLRVLFDAERKGYDKLIQKILKDPRTAIHRR